MSLLKKAGQEAAKGAIETVKSELSMDLEPAEEVGTTCKTEAWWVKPLIFVGGLAIGVLTGKVLTPTEKIFVIKN